MFEVWRFIILKSNKKPNLLERFFFNMHSNVVNDSMKNGVRFYCNKPSWGSWHNHNEVPTKLKVPSLLKSCILVSLHYFQLLFLWGHLAWHEASIPNHPLPLSTTPHPLSEASFHAIPWRTPYCPIHKPKLHTSSHHGKNRCLARYWKSTRVLP